MYVDFPEVEYRIPGKRTQVHRERKILRHVFTPSVKRSVRKFLEVAVRNGKEMYQKELLFCTCKIVVFLIKPIALFTFSLPNVVFGS